MGITMTLPPTCTIGAVVPLTWTRSDTSEPASFDLVLFNDTCIGCPNCTPCDGIGDQLVQSGDNVLSGQVQYRVPGNITEGTYHVEPLSTGLFQLSSGFSNSFKAVSAPAPASNSSTSSSTATTGPTSTSTSITSNTAVQLTQTTSSPSSSPSLSPTGQTQNSSSSTSGPNSNSGSNNIPISSASNTQNSSSSTSGPNSNSDSNNIPISSASNTKNSGIIVAIVICALIAFSSLLIFIWWFRRGRTWRRKQPLIIENSGGEHPAMRSLDVGNMDLVPRPFVGTLNNNSLPNADGPLIPIPNESGPTKRQLLLEAQARDLESRMVTQVQDQGPPLPGIPNFTTSQSTLSQLSSPNSTSNLISDSQISQSSRSDSERVIAENARLRAEIQWLRQQYESPWALGLTDEPPPSYSGTVVNANGQ